MTIDHGLRCACAVIMLIGCGDAGGDTLSASGSATESTSPGSTSTGQQPTSGDSESATATTTGVGGSMTEGTSVGTGSTSTGEVSGTGSTGESSGGSSAGETGPGLCLAPDLSPGMVMIDPACTIDEMVGTFTPTIEWQNNTLGVTYTTPAIANVTDDNADGKIDGDDIPDLAVVTQAGILHVMSGDGSGEHWASAEVIGFEPSAATIADLDADGKPEVVASGGNGFFAYHGDTGALMWSNPMGGSQTICGATSVYDIDGDGKPEVVQGNRIFNGQDGSLRGTGAFGKGTGYGGDLVHMGVVADLDQDGTQEVVVGNAAYDADGNAKWSTGQPDGFVAIGDFDDDVTAEVVVAWWGGNVRLQEHDGTVIWMTNIGGGTIGAPTIADFDGDGEPEIGVAGQNIYAVLDGDGSTIWTKVIADGSGFTGSSVFDFEGDGAAEVVYADEQDLWVFDGKTGTVKLQEMSHSSATCSEYPSIADVDNDGHAEIVFTTDLGVSVVGDMNDSWRRSRVTWNQHTYHITNVSGPAGEIPAAQETNWLSFNNFRSASTSGSAADAVPVILEVCELECPDHISVWFQIGNAGTADLPPGVHASLYGLQNGNWVFLTSVVTDAPIASGATSPGFAALLAPADVIDGQLRLVVDDDNGVDIIDECHEDNNTAEFMGDLCHVRVPT